MHRKFAFAPLLFRFLPLENLLLTSKHTFEISTGNSMHAARHFSSARCAHARAHAALPTPLQLQPFHQAAHHDQVLGLDKARGLLLEVAHHNLQCSACILECWTAGLNAANGRRWRNGRREGQCWCRLRLQHGRRYACRRNDCIRNGIVRRWWRVHARA